MMRKGEDGSHDYREAIKMHTPDQPNSSSTGPMPAGGVGPSGETNNVPDMSAFSNAHAQSRSGDGKAPTMAGHLGMGPMMDESTHSYDPGSDFAPGVPRVMNGDRAYAWRDASGGSLGSHPDGYEK